MGLMDFLGFFWRNTLNTGRLNLIIVILDTYALMPDYLYLLKFLKKNFWKIDQMKRKN